MAGSVADLEAALDPVMTDYGFAAGQDGGNSGEDAEVIWCASYADLQGTHPWLPQATGQDSVHDYACVDLVVSLKAGRIAHIDFEAVSLEDTFITLNEPSAARRASDLLGAPVSAVSAELAKLLRMLFELNRTSAGRCHP